MRSVGFHCRNACALPALRRSPALPSPFPSARRTPASSTSSSRPCTRPSQLRNMRRNRSIKRKGSSFIVRRILVARLHPAKGAHAAPVVGLMDDESLRNGDVVMTADGIRVFTGSAGSASQTTTISPEYPTSRGLSKTQRSALLFLDSGAAARGPSSRSSPDAPWRTAHRHRRDDYRPGGNKIRYVGP